MKESVWDVDPVFGGRSATTTDRYLFHYTSVESAAGIALTRSLALSPLTPMNDPRESQVRQVATMKVVRKGTAGVTPREREAFETELWTRRRRVRLGCFTEDRIEGRPGHAEREDLRGYAHSRMWTQYAAGQTGVCLVLDRSQLLEAAHLAFGRRLTHGPVGYVEGFDAALVDAETVDFTTPDVTRHHVERVLPSLLVKNGDWRSEREYRVVVDDWDEGACLLPLDGVVAGLAFGLSVRPHQLHVIDAVADQFGLADRVAQLVLNCGVLQAWPGRGRDGRVRALSDGETRSGTCFEPED